MDTQDLVYIRDNQKWKLSFYDIFLSVVATI